MSTGGRLPPFARSVSYRNQLRLGAFVQVGELAFAALQHGARLLPGRKKCGAPDYSPLKESWAARALLSLGSATVKTNDVDTRECNLTGCCAARRAAVKGPASRPFGRPSLTRARRYPPRPLARRVAPDCGPWAPGRCARQCSDQGGAFIAMHNTKVRPAMPARMTTATRSRARGSRALFPSRVRERGPLDELTGLQVAALLSVRCTPARSSPRSPAMPDAGPLNAMK